MSYEIESQQFGMMPNQAFGTLNGRPFYFRARHGGWSLRVAGETSQDPVEGEVIAHGEHPRAGWWEDHEAAAFLENILKEHSK